LEHSGADSGSDIIFAGVLGEIAAQLAEANELARRKPGIVNMDESTVPVVRIPRRNVTEAIRLAEWIAGNQDGNYRDNADKIAHLLRAG
jgi:hypothetical protein